MSLRIAPELWTTLCDYLKAHPTCKVTLHQHEGQVRSLDLSLTVKADRCLVPMHPSPLPRTNGERALILDDGH